MEYKPIQKKNLSWTPTTVQKKGKSPGKMGHFSIQPKSNLSSAPSQEIGEYSRASADRLAANVMRGIQAKEQEQAEESTLQRKSESPWAPTFDAPPPLAQSPASQLCRDRPWKVSTFAPVSENPIQRQCADCAKEEEEQATEAGKDLEEIGIQTKLTVGAPGDPYEQEADSVETRHGASLQVISMSAPPDSSASVQRQLDTNHPHHPHQIWQRAQSITPVVQRQIDPRVQMRQMIQQANQIDGNQASGDLESRLNASKGGGSPLSENVRGFMEPRFGADFSGVRVHTGGEAVQMNQELGAQAFTHGSDVYFGAGKSPGNNELTAHELTHVVQQNEEVLRNKNEQTENSQIHSQEIQTIVSCQRSEGYLQAQEEQSHSQSESNPESLLTSQERSGVQELLSGMNGINRNAALFIAGAFYQWLRNNGELGRWVLEAVSLGTSSVSEDLEAVEESLPRSGPFEMGRTAGDLAGIVTGVLEMIAGGGAVAGGGSLCLTGIGCIAGAPATVVGGATAVHGGSVVIEGTGNIAEDFAGLVSQVFAISGGGEGNGGDTNDINWEWKSKPTFGHTFNRHYAYTTARNSRRHGEITFTIAIN